MLKELRETRGLSQIELAEKIGVSERTIRKYEQDEDSIQIGVYKKMLKILEMSSNDFVSLSSNTKENVQQSSKMSSNMSSNAEFLSPNRQKVSSNPPKPHFINIPVYDEVFASAGNGRFNEECVSFYYSLERSLLKSCFKLSNCENLAFLRVSGDSMTPTLPPNARLLAQTRTEFKEGQIVLARLDDDLFVKRLHKQPHLKLVSDNEKYEPIILQGKDYELIAVIVGFLMSFEN